MTQAEKAKRYDEAIINGSRLWECGLITREAYENIFSELKDEDEEIRKEILSFLREGQPYYSPNSTKRQEWAAWLEKQNFNINKANKEYWRGYREGKQEVINKYAELEKQSEKKPADKVEPKFKEGDWVICGDNFRSPLKIVSVSDKLYTAVDIQGVSFRPLIEYLDKHYHRWTIQDAKDGDVLVTDSWLYIFKYTNNKNLIQFHCNFPINGKPYNWCILSNDSYLDIYIDANIHPATKEQRDILFQKMKETGYEWDAERKELKRILSFKNIIQWKKH